MDRRELLIGMAAAGLAGQLDLTQLLQAQNPSAPNQKPTTRVGYPPEAVIDDMRGPIRMCMEESEREKGIITTTTEYDADGRLVSSHVEKNGRPVDEQSSTRSR